MILIKTDWDLPPGWELDLLDAEFQAASVPEPTTSVLLPRYLGDPIASATSLGEPSIRNTTGFAVDQYGLNRRMDVLAHRKSVFCLVLMDYLPWLARNIRTQRQRNWRFSILCGSTVPPRYEKRWNAFLPRRKGAKPRGYTTVMSLMDVMHGKGLLKRKAQGRAFVYSPKADQAKTLKKMVGDLLSRAFQGSSSALVTHLLDQATPTESELDAIRSAIEQHQRNQKGKQ